MDHFLEQAGMALRGETQWAWPAALLLSIIITLIVKAILKLISSRLRKLALRTSSRWDDVAVDLMDGLKWGVILVWAFYGLGHMLQPSERIHQILQFFLVLFSGYQFLIWGLYLIRNWRETFLEERIGRDASSASVLGLLYVGVQTGFIVFVILVGLSNIGVNIGALITGLGVGGIAVALAAQNVLGDLLASLSIVLDKPFIIGDFIVVGSEAGSIEKIGIKTTRVRALSGEQMVFSNKDLLESRIHNYKRMNERRVVQSFGVVYSTPADVMDQIPGWVKEIIQKESMLRFDRCHFAKFGDSSLDFEFVFYVNSPDYNIFMDLQQKVLMGIMRKLQSAGVDFAFPSRTLYFDGPLNIRQKNTGDGTSQNTPT